MSLVSRMLRKYRHHAYRPAIRITPVSNVVELGTPYGGWNFIDNGRLKGSTVISAGLGEDASFDVLFAARYGARVLIVDPTPRAIAHFRGIQSRIGSDAEGEFVAGGCQPLTAYDLRKVRPDSLILIDKALWVRNEPVRFFQPANPQHVSHSITNLFNKQAADAPYIEVPGTTIPEIMARHAVDEIAILKIDIEGAEIDVLNDMIGRNIHPDQILVEFDEIADPSWVAKIKYEGCDRMLRDAGYVCVCCKGGVNFTYARAASVSR